MTHGGLLAIFAHPDDETFGVGGIMSRYSHAGVPCTMVSATRGEVGQIAPGTDATPETLGEHRERELREAMAILGVDDVRFLDFRDSGMHGTPENEDARNLINAEPESVIQPLVRVIRERRPEAIVTWDASGGYGHPDHIAVHERATTAFHAAADPSVQRGDGDPWRTPRLFYLAFPLQVFSDLTERMREMGLEGFDLGDDARIAELPRVDPNCVIDVSAEYERKERALLAHRTQLQDMEPLMQLPEEIRRGFFAREYFYRAHPALGAGVTIDDLLAR